MGHKCDWHKKVKSDTEQDKTRKTFACSNSKNVVCTLSVGALVQHGLILKTQSLKEALHKNTCCMIPFIPSSRKEKTNPWYPITRAAVALGLLEGGCQKWLGRGLRELSGIMGLFNILTRV